MSSALSGSIFLRSFRYLIKEAVALLIRHKAIDAINPIRNILCKTSFSEKFRFSSIKLIILTFFLTICCKPGKEKHNDQKTRHRGLQKERGSLFPLTDLFNGLFFFTTPTVTFEVAKGGSNEQDKTNDAGGDSDNSAYSFNHIFLFFFLQFRMK